MGKGKREKWGRGERKIEKGKKNREKKKDNKRQ